MKSLNDSLEDTNITVLDSISDTDSDRFWDVWFDNIYMDIKSQTKIEESLKQLQEFRTAILALISRLDENIVEIENKQ